MQKEMSSVFYTQESIYKTKGRCPFETRDFLKKIE